MKQLRNALICATIIASITSAAFAGSSPRPGRNNAQYFGESASSFSSMAPAAGGLSACSKEIKSFCEGTKGTKAQAECLGAHPTNLSSACSAAVTKTNEKI
jgi:hypothetical protein